MAEAKIQPVSLEPAAFEVGNSENECVLLGNRCPQCDLVFFPRRHFCTRCSGSGLEENQLSKKGRLLSFTTVYQKPKFANVGPPYLMGEVDLPEKVVIYSLLIQSFHGELKIGGEVELTAVKVREEEREGKRVAVFGYAFRPF
ncbi:MAG: Zn-ribbon domain-containing OB-fold protein [Rhodospirillales bacterium]